MRRGRRCNRKDLTVEQAEQAIIGYMIFNDWSARDLQQLEANWRSGRAKARTAA